MIDHPQLELVEVGAAANLRPLDALEVGPRMASASRMVSAIPALCAAPPGLLSTLDLAGLVREVAGPSPDSRLF